jgi:hypothetical protein
VAVIYTYTIRNVKCNCTNVHPDILMAEDEMVYALDNVGCFHTTSQSGRPGMATVGHQKVDIIITVNNNRLENKRNSFTSKNMAL